VPRYFLNVRYKPGPDGLAQDQEGDELPDAAGLADHLRATARHLVSHARITGVNWRKSTFEVTDETGALVLTLHLGDVTP
jgi:hypothetical protein